VLVILSLFLFETDTSYQLGTRKAVKLVILSLLTKNPIGSEEFVFLMLEVRQAMICAISMIQTTVHYFK